MVSIYRIELNGWKVHYSDWELCLEQFFGRTISGVETISSASLFSVFPKLLIVENF
jgi:hypothetical protein